MVNKDLSTLTLATAADGWVYHASCGDCAHTRRLDLVLLRRSLGGEFFVSDIRHHLRCALCRSRDVIVACVNAAASRAHFCGKQGETGSGVRSAEC